MTRATELAPGTELDGTYRIVEPLGEGGMGAVYVAELIRLPKRVALKVLHVAADEGAKARFRREAEIAAKVRHPRVVEVLDYNFLQDGSPYLVMELLDGHDLRHRMAQGPIPPEETAAILSDAASALERLHELGIVHRDLKPENIFLAQEGDEIRAKVLDFGISKVLGTATALTADRTVLGTPAYMAPEQVTGENEALDPRTDQFALAAVAYEMLSGQPAFRAESVIQLFHRILTEPPPTVTGDPQRTPADEVLAKALAKSKEERYPSVRAFVSALADALGTDAPRASGVDAMAETVASGELPVADAPAPDRRRPGHRALFIGLAASAIVAGLVAALTLGGGEERGAPADADPRPTAEAQAVVDAEPEPEPEPPAASPEPDPHEPEPEPEPEPEATPEPEPEAAATAPKPRAQARASGKPSDPEALKEFRAAEAGLTSNDARAAIRHARRSLQKERSMAARAVLAKAHCAKRDLGLAKAMARGLWGASLKDAKRYCREQGIDL
ncbi:MAG: serine/threonine-protein kinase [Myxococcota bacterium]